MPNSIRYLLAFSALAFVAAALIGTTSDPVVSAQKDGRQAELKWFKGNTHTHTINSDGDSTPDDVVKWYREHGYNFLVLTDHNFLTATAALNELHGAEGQFIVMRGEEITDRYAAKPIHVNGINLDRLVNPQGGTGVLDVIQRAVDAIRSANGVPHINHPNFGWAITVDDLKKVQNDKLFEIYNGHPLVNNLGGGGVPGTEEIWDQILTSGKLLYGIAVDDAHHFKRPGDPAAAGPGRGWVVVRAHELSAAAVTSALEHGDFYASTGVELADYQADDKRIAVTIKEERTSKYRVQFIGSGGRILSESVSSPAVYQIRGNEGYVRARILESNGKMAWTQPLMVKP